MAQTRSGELSLPLNGEFTLNRSILLLRSSPVWPSRCPSWGHSGTTPDCPCWDWRLLAVAAPVPQWVLPAHPTLTQNSSLAQSQLSHSQVPDMLWAPAWPRVHWAGREECQWQLQLLPRAQQCWFVYSKGLWNQQTALNSCAHWKGLETKQSDKYLCSKAAMTTRGDGILFKDFYRACCHLLLKSDI